MRQYDANGCYSRLVIFKGLQLRGHSLTDKPAAFSFKHLWNGANPILNLGLGYEPIDGEEVIRIEEKSHWYDPSQTSIDIANARIVREYDTDYIFNKIKIGYQKWEGENLSGLDDPQTSQIRSTILEPAKEINIISEFVAASLTIEGTRRRSIDLSKDYKYDNDTFVILLNDDDLSPDRYRPETTEHFDSVSGLLNAITRYNILLTPMRNFLRWANYFNGCLQKYLTSSFKFASGEGNVNLVTEYSCSSGEQCLGVICDPISEDSDISLAYNDTFGTLHVPDMAIIEMDISCEEYLQIQNNRKKAIGVSQSDVNFIKFLPRKISFKPAFTTVGMELWSSVPFQLTVPESVQPALICSTGEVGGDPGGEVINDFDICYQAILTYGESI
jgi:hypothetical protein